MIQLENVSKIYNKKPILKNVNLKINSGEFIVLIGESGCGKTTLLKLLNKLIEPSSGDITIDEKLIKDENSIQLRRKIGYVIQKVGLMPHMSIGENIEIIPKLLHWDKNIMKKRSIELLELMGLDPSEYYDRFPSELSGGQKQRVGIARALANNPEIILMDEPFSALDPVTRENLQDEILNLHRELEKTIIFVTHDMDEALKLGQKIAILKDGEIIQYDTPENILKKPANEFVETFIGKNRLWKNPDMLLARDIMRTHFLHVSINRTLLFAISIMDEHDLDYLVVTEKNKNTGKNKAVGVLVKKDINFDYLSKHISLEEVMRTDFQSIEFDENLTNIIKEINNLSIKIIVVTDRKENLIGVITPNRLLTILSNMLS